MGRRTVLLIVAALIAAVGSGLVFMYARGADSRAEATQAPVQVLKAVQRIDSGETFSQAQSEGKIQLGTVPRRDLLVGAVNTSVGLTDKVATTTIYPNEQIVTGKFGSGTTAVESPLAVAKGNLAISVTLSDTGRVAGFVTPGAKVAVFDTVTDDASGGGASGGGGTNLLLPKVSVIAVGDTTTVAKTTTTATGDETTEQLPNTLFTLSVSQRQAERLIFASTHGELSFGLLTTESRVAPGPGVTAANLLK